MDLKKEFSESRQQALKMTPENIEAAEALLERVIVPQLRNQQRINPTSSYYCITFYAVEHAGGYYVVCNTNLAIDCGAGSSNVNTTKEVLSVAVFKALDMYNINAYEFYEDSINYYRFEISI